jgi:tRNA N6-adenosine threonylcarbamoyltransferase
VVCLIVSGGHTELILMQGHGRYRRLGATLDDAAGEAFDKVARLLGLPYPGGPAIEQVALNGRAEAYRFPRAWLEGTYDFSFSGLKTAVLRVVRKLQPELKAGLEAPRAGLPVPDLAASFQAAVVDVLVTKAVQAVKEFEATQLFVAGGVSANGALREALRAAAPVPVRTPPPELCTDNAAMIAAAGTARFLAGQRDPLDIDVLPGWKLESIGG